MKKKLLSKCPKCGYPLLPTFVFNRRSLVYQGRVYDLAPRCVQVFEVLWEKRGECIPASRFAMRKDYTCTMVKNLRRFLLRHEIPYTVLCVRGKGYQLVDSFTVEEISYESNTAERQEDYHP